MLADVDQMQSNERLHSSGQRNKEDEMNDARKLIEEKIAAYVPDEEKDENAEFHGTEMISVS